MSVGLFFCFIILLKHILSLQPKLKVNLWTSYPNIRRIDSFKLPHLHFTFPPQDNFGQIDNPILSVFETLHPVYITVNMASENLTPCTLASCFYFQTDYFPVSDNLKSIQLWWNVFSFCLPYARLWDHLVWVSTGYSLTRKALVVCFPRWVSSSTHFSVWNS